jgi:hypothetical protein
MEQKLSRDCEESRRGGFRHILPFLAIPLVIGMVRGVVRHKYAHMDKPGRGEWKNGVPPMFAELHRRAHAAEAENC